MFTLTFPFYISARNSVEQELSKAEELWTAGDKDGAVSKYKAVLESNSQKAALKDEERAIVYGRLMDYKCERGNREAAKQWHLDAAKRKVVPVVNHPDAKAIINSEQKKR